MDDISAEVYQKAFTILYFNIKDGKITELTSSLKTYLYAIAKNVFKERFRDKHKQVLDLGFEKKVASWEQKYKLNKEDFEEKVSYTLDGLVAMFRPVNIYEKRIAKELVGTRQLGGLKVKYPENETDCLEEVTFELEQSVNDVLKLSIENNEEDEVLKKVIETNTIRFTINIKNFKPGRYY